MGRAGGRQGGFTIIELTVVLAIIGLLAAIAVPQYLRTLQQAKENRLIHDLRVMRDLIQQYKVDKKKYPESLQALVDGSYLKVIPVDTLTGSNSTWVEVHNEPSDPEDTEADTGVVDVKSGAPGNNLDGIPYGEL